MGKKARALRDSRGTVRLPAVYVERVKALAELRGCFQARILKEALDGYLDKAEQRAREINR